METQTRNTSTTGQKLDKSTFIWVALGVIIVTITGFHLWSTFSTEPQILTESVTASVPDFNLTNQQGQPLGLSDMEGKIWIADFIFTNCPTICPAMTQEMARLQSEFVADPVYFVSFSVDPERDTSAVLARYATAYGADDRRWHFLTGNKAKIYQLAEKGFSLAAGQSGSEILHSSRFVLVKPDGNIHNHYDSQDVPAMRRLRQDVKALLKK